MTCMTFWSPMKENRCYPSNIQIILRSLVYSFFWMLTGCAGLPDVNYDAMRLADPTDAHGHVSYIKDMEERQSGHDFIDGNQVTLLQNGVEAYPSMLAAIHSAKKRIDIESFVFDQIAGAQFADALMERVRHGIQVNLIYDSYGSSDTPDDLFQKLQHAGVQTIEYNPVVTSSVLDISANNRDHRKLLIVDNRVAFTGGINISAVYKIRHDHHHWWKNDDDDLDLENTAWRDTQVRIEGPAVTEFEKLFVETWRDQDGPFIDEMSQTKQHAEKNPAKVQVIDGYPTKDRFTIYQSLIMAITLARHSVHLATGYFVPPPDLVRVLRDAALRGVDVDLLVPGKSDSDLALQAGRDSYSDLMQAGAKIYERQGDVLHEKIAIIDDVWSTVGSSNLDWRSAATNNECNAVVLGTSFGAEMEAMFHNDLQQARLIDPVFWQNRGLLEKLHEQRAVMMETFL